MLLPRIHLLFTTICTWNKTNKLVSKSIKNLKLKQRFPKNFHKCVLFQLIIRVVVQESGIRGWFSIIFKMSKPQVFGANKFRIEFSIISQLLLLQITKTIVFGSQKGVCKAKATSTIQHTKIRRQYVPAAQTDFLKQVRNNKSSTTWKFTRTITTAQMQKVRRE